MPAAIARVPRAHVLGDGPRLVRTASVTSPPSHRGQDTRRRAGARREPQVRARRPHDRRPASASSSSSARLFGTAGRFMPPGRPPPRPRLGLATRREGGRRLVRGTMRFPHAAIIARVDVVELRARVERFVRGHELLEPGGEVTCLVSGGPDSTCLWHVLRELGYASRRCTWTTGSAAPSPRRTPASAASSSTPRSSRRRGEGEDRGRAARPALRGRGRAAARHRAHGLRPGRDRPLPPRLERDDEGDQAAPRGRRRAAAARRLARGDGGLLPRGGLAFRVDSSNRDTKRGLIREEILPLLEQLHPGARENLLRLRTSRRRSRRRSPSCSRRPRARSASTSAAASRPCASTSALWLEDGPVALDGDVRWGPWRISAGVPGLKVRGWRAGDRLAGRSKKVQDVFVDAKIPRSEREAWPLVVRGDEVVAIPGLVEHPDVEAERVAD